MKFRILFLTLLFTAFTSQASAQSDSLNKKLALDDEFTIEFTEIRRTGQGALMLKFTIEAINGSNDSGIDCNDSMVTDLATKSVYHTMGGQGTSAGNKYFNGSAKVNCWTMISEPPASLKSALFTLEKFPPVEIELP